VQSVPLDFQKFWKLNFLDSSRKKIPQIYIIRQNIQRLEFSYPFQLLYATCLPWFLDVARSGRGLDWPDSIEHSLNGPVGRSDCMEVPARPLAGLFFAATSLSLGDWIQSDCIGRRFHPGVYQSRICVGIKFPAQRHGWHSLCPFELWDCYIHDNPLPSRPLASFQSPPKLEFLVALRRLLRIDRTWQFLEESVGSNRRTTRGKEWR